MIGEPEQYWKSPFFSEHLILNLAFSPLKKTASDNLERENWRDNLVLAIVWCT